MWAINLHFLALPFFSFQFQIEIKLRPNSDPIETKRAESVSSIYIGYKFLFVSLYSFFFPGQNRDQIKTKLRPNGDQKSRIG